MNTRTTTGDMLIAKAKFKQKQQSYILTAMKKAKMQPSEKQRRMDEHNERMQEWIEFANQLGRTMQEAAETLKRMSELLASVMEQNEANLSNANRKPYPQPRRKGKIKPWGVG